MFLSLHNGEREDNGSKSYPPGQHRLAGGGPAFLFKPPLGPGESNLSGILFIDCRHDVLRSSVAPEESSIRSPTSESYFSLSPELAEVFVVRSPKSYSPVAGVCIRRFRAN